MRRCVICEVMFEARNSQTKTCSLLCRHEQRQKKEQSRRNTDWCRERRSEQQRRWRAKLSPEARRAINLRNRPAKNRKQKAKRKAQRLVRIEARDRHLEIKEVERQMNYLRWALWGDGLFETSRGAIPVFTKQELMLRQRENCREQSRKRRQKELTALKIFRELGFIASRHDRRNIYLALKAELNLQAKGD